MGSSKEDESLIVPETLKRPIAIITRLGLYSENKCKRMSLAAFYALFPATLIIAALFQFKNMKYNVSEFVSNLEAITGFAQLFGKILVVACRRKDFVKLFEKTRQFWSTNECEAVTKRELDFLSDMILRIQRLFLPLEVVAVIFIILTPLFGSALCIGVWTMEGHNSLYRTILALQPPTLSFSTYLVYGFDCMYLAFCVEIIIQFRIICHHLEKLGTPVNKQFEEVTISYVKKIKLCAIQHNFLQEFVNEFQDLYSMALLVEYLTDGPLICVELYAAVDSKSIQLQFRHVAVFLLVTTQFAFFCIPANYIANEALNIANAAYFSNWYSVNNPSLKAPLIFVIQNSQREVTLKAGGLVTINANTLLTILKVAWSASSVMRDLK